MKKFAIVIASLALILPLASVGNSASAKKVNQKQTVRVIKKSHHAHKSNSEWVGEHMDDHGNVKGHHYYKFAYNKKEYRKALRDMATNHEGIKKLDHKYFGHKSYAFKVGFNDALKNTQHRNLVNNKQYEYGYLVADAATIDGKVTKKTINSGKTWYNDFKKNGPATAPADEQIKWEAHIDTL